MTKLVINQKAVKLLIVLLSALFISLPQAHAFPSILNNFNSTYSTSSTKLDQCATCHISNGNYSFNPYGSDLSSSGISFSAIESFDSDGDSYSNIDEIKALVFPGDANDFPPSANIPPVSNPSGPYTGTVGSSVQFDGSASTDQDGTIISYQWDFGDGATDSGVNPTHSYATTGIFTVMLTVEDELGATDSASTTATIGAGNQAPVANPSGPYTGTVGSAVQFDGSGSTDQDGTIISYQWDFGDGTTATVMSPTHAYTMAGIYNVTLTVMDDTGTSDSATTTASINDIQNQPPVADANGPYTGTVAEPVVFDGSASSDPDGTIAQYDWDFGDGNVLNNGGATPSHSYQAEGSFTVVLTVTDDAGTSSSDTTTATISTVEQYPPVADANGPYSGTVGIEVKFDGSASSDPDGEIISYYWDFGDGMTGSDIMPTHTYMANGEYTVTLTVTDDAGLSDTTTTTATIAVGNQPPVADANGPYSGTVNVDVQFDGTASYDPEGGPLTYNWNFGDGSYGDGATPTHSYSLKGVYNVTLTVTDETGATDSQTTNASIEETDPPNESVDLDIREFEVDRWYRIGNRKGIEIELKVKNRGMIDKPRLATITGVQNGTEVYHETMMVSAPVDNKSREFEFPRFKPSKSGKIFWVATIDDDDSDIDEASAVTYVKGQDSENDDDDRNKRDDD